MANKRIVDLTNQATQSDAYYIELDDPTWGATRKQTVGTLLSGEVTTRLGADTATRTGAGLETDGSYDPEATSNYLKAGNFATAGLTETLFNADLLLDAQLAAMAALIDGYSTLETTLVRVTAPRVGILKTYPVELIAAPGANKMIQVISAGAFLNEIGANWDAGADTADISYTSGNIGTFTNAFVESGADAYETMVFNATTTAYSNEAVRLTSANDWSGAGDGDNELYIWLLYYTIDWTAYNVEI